MAFELPPLPYAYDALEPYIDARTMEIHHTKHHGGYVAKTNAALEKNPKLQGKSIEDLLRDLNAIPEDIRTAIRNNGGGHFNHSIFWTIMAPNAGGEPVGNLARALHDTFGGFRQFKEQFSNTAVTHFGSGWAWLAMDARGKLSVFSTLNQDSPISQGFQPIMGLDVWEHAYYLKYQNRRPEYVENWWNVVNWEAIEERYNSLK